MAWACQTATNGDYAGVFSAENTYPFLGATASGQPFWQTTSGSLTGDTPLSPGYHRLVGTISSTAGMTLFVDSIPIKSDPSGTSSTAGSPIRLMGATPLTYRWTGFGDSWAVHTKALSATEVAWDYDEEVMGCPVLFNYARRPSAKPGGGIYSRRRPGYGRAGSRQMG